LVSFLEAMRIVSQGYNMHDDLVIDSSLPIVKKIKIIGYSKFVRQNELWKVIYMSKIFQVTGMPNKLGFNQHW